MAGTAGGRRLTVPPAGTRPTSDRAREALFASLHTLLELDGCHALDLYAGSGAVGLEALSRGAASVTLVESDRRAAAVLRENVAAVGLPGAQVVVRDVRAWARGADDGRFDLVFADPPYALGAGELAGVLTDLAGRYASGAVVVVERSARDPDWTWPTPLEALRHKRYGEAVLWYGRASVTEGSSVTERSAEIR